MATTKAAQSDQNSETHSMLTHPPIIKLGKIKKRHAKKLKQGRGLLMGEVQQAIQNVKNQLSSNTEHHPVVISYEEKPKKKRKKKNIKLFGMKINRKKMKKKMKKNGISSTFL